MSVISRMRKQTCVYWALRGVESGGEDYDEFGQPQYTDPVQLACRWEVKTVEFLSPQGTQELSNAVVYVDQDVDVGGVLMLGELTDIDSSLTVPKQNEETWEIRRFEKLPNFRNTEFLRTVFL